MALHDLTPQLRTRLNPLERVVGWFLVLATVLLVTGFGYYLHHTAQRKGWFLTKAPYYTFTDTALGLKVGDPVTFFGFPAGQITVIDSMPPEAPERVYVEFAVRDPYYGYIWTDGSLARVSPAGFLGARGVEVTKGLGGYPTYLFHPLREVTLAEARALPTPTRWKLAAEIREPATNLIFKALTPLSGEVLDRLAQLRSTPLPVVDTSETRKRMTAVWNDNLARYEEFTGRNKYFLMPDETPALSERLERMMVKVDKSLPKFLALSTPLSETASNAVLLTSNLNHTLTAAQPAISNLVALTAQIQGPGQLGEWLLPTNLNAELQVALTNLTALLDTSDRAIASADTNLTAALQSLTQSLDELGGITSSLRAQVEANTNLLSAISQSVVNTDDLVQGLKRHWLLRSAFKKPPEPKAPRTNAPPTLLSPRDPRFR
jgi:hypothetical protein